VVIFTAHEERHIIAQALRQGARGYVLKGAPSQELIGAIRAAHRGELYLQPRVAALWAATLRSPVPGLTPRQREILLLVAAGRSNKEIAAQLGLSERTAKFHVTAIFTRLGADNRAQAVALAAQLGLL
jgi:DNA-binding NarL/FixJ family response regulator